MSIRPAERKQHAGFIHDGDEQVVAVFLRVLKAVKEFQERGPVQIIVRPAHPDDAYGRGKPKGTPIRHVNYYPRDEEFTV